MVYKRNQEVVKRNIAGEVFLIPVCNNIADMRNVYVLQGVGEFIWDRLEKPGSESGICSHIVEHYEADEDEVMQDLNVHLAELVDAGLVSVVDEE